MSLELKTDREWKIYNEGLKKPHKTSQETRNLIKSMEDKFDNLKDKVTNFEINVTKGMGEMKLEIIEAMVKNTKEMKEDCDNRYAPIWAANALKIVMVAVTLALTGTVMSLLLK